MPNKPVLCLWVVSAFSASACGGNTASSEAPGSHLRTTISAVQGPGDQSPLQGRMVTVTGLVSGDFQDRDANPASRLGGFYLQSEHPDDDDATSEGLFVYDRDNNYTDVSTGQRVTVTGVVQEFFGETQLKASHVQVDGSGTLRILDVELPWPDDSLEQDFAVNLERYEGMLLRFPQTLTVSDLYGLERFGEVLLSLDGRLQQFTNIARPDAKAYAAHRRANASRSIMLDDGQRAANVQPIRYLRFGEQTANTLRIGDRANGLVGNLRFSRGSGSAGAARWRLMPTSEPVFESANPRTDAPRRRGNLRIASFNVLNLFSKIDTGRNNCGPASTDACRGADSQQEQARQLAKIVTALTLIDADIVGLIELENNRRASLSTLVDALNDRLGKVVYDYVNTGTIGRDAIKTGLLFKPDTVALSGEFALLDATVDRRFDDRLNRPALAQTFTRLANGASLTVIVNHLKSKGSPCDQSGDPHTGDGQGNCNRTRTAAADALLAWIASGTTRSGEDDVLLIGDLNAYTMEDPVVALENGGLSNLMDQQNPARYSFVYNGQSGALDHALASPSLGRQLVAASTWHINADEAPALDYNLEHGRDPALFDAELPYRSSDHDPLIIDLQLE